MRYSGGDCFEHQFREGLYSDFIFLHFPQVWCLWRGTQSCAVCGLRVGLYVHHWSYPAPQFLSLSNFGSHSTLACSPTELPRIQQCYRMNRELLFVRSCCFITAVRLMSNLFFAWKFIFFFSFCKMGSGKGMEGGS